MGQGDIHCRRMREALIKLCPVKNWAFKGRPGMGASETMTLTAAKEIQHFSNIITVIQKISFEKKRGKCF